MRKRELVKESIYIMSKTADKTIAQKVSKQISDMKRFTTERTQTQVESADLLFKAGICTEKGNLKKHYR